MFLYTQHILLKKIYYNKSLLLGYNIDNSTKKLIVNEWEEKTVKIIFAFIILFICV